MNDKLIMSAIVGIIAAIPLTFWAMNKPSVVNVTNTPATQGTQTYGAVAGPDLYSPYLCVNGVCQWFNHIPMAQATTTLCAIKSPAATSTLGRSTVNFAISTTSATILTIAKASTPYATTTIIGTAYAIAANAPATVIASSSPAAGAVTVFGPNQYLVVGLQGGIGTFTPTGTCNATFETI